MVLRGAYDDVNPAPDAQAFGAAGALNPSPQTSLDLSDNHSEQMQPPSYTLRVTNPDPTSSSSADHDPQSNDNSAKPASYSPQGNPFVNPPLFDSYEDQVQRFLRENSPDKLSPAEAEQLGFSTRFSCNDKKTKPKLKINKKTVGSGSAVPSPLHLLGNGQSTFLPSIKVPSNDVNIEPPQMSANSATSGASFPGSVGGPDDTLFHFGVTNNHIENATSTLHGRHDYNDQVTAGLSQMTKAIAERLNNLAQAHDEMKQLTTNSAELHDHGVKVVNERISDLYELFNASEHNHGRVAGETEAMKGETKALKGETKALKGETKAVKEKLNELVQHVQTTFVDRLELMMSMNAKMNDKMDLVMERLREIERKGEASSKTKKGEVDRTKARENTRDKDKTLNNPSTFSPPAPGQSQTFTTNPPMMPPNATYNVNPYTGFSPQYSDSGAWIQPYPYYPSYGGHDLGMRGPDFMSTQDERRRAAMARAQQMGTTEHPDAWVREQYARRPSPSHNNESGQGHGNGHSHGHGNGSGSGQYGS